jgi:long-subunit acyl-CoA synthetase (AMP-forming)
MAKGPNIMIGYFNNEEATREAIDEEGWFHTGDIGHLDDDGYLFITDRKKNILVTSAGKNVAPAPMENAMVNSPYIEQSVVIGDKRNFISALIVPSFEAIDSDGWFHTGDIGHLDDDGYLFITDRKKNILVTSGGKNVAPAPMENAMVNSPYIEQSVVIGDKRNFISALIVPSFEAIENYLKEQGKPAAGNKAIVENPDVNALIRQEVATAMESFSNYERVKEFGLLPRLFTLENGELTPTLKVVRKVVLENFSDDVDKIYSGSKESEGQMEAELF